MDTMDRKKMVLEIIEVDGFKGNGMDGVHQCLELAYLSDLELTNLWLKKSKLLENITYKEYGSESEERIDSV